MSDSNNGSKILLVEDEESLAIGLEFNLEEEGYVVQWAKDGYEALQYFSAQKFDLIILDIMLPFYDGFEVAQKVREKSPQIPILILTARTTANDRVHGLDIGADDYMTKPFHLQELLLRIKGMLRRKKWYRDLESVPSVYRFGDNEINFETLKARSAAKFFDLTHREAMIMKYLIENKGKIISRKELLEKVWNINSNIETRTIDNFIVRLRKYFEIDSSHPVYFKSVRSAGYLFADE